MSFVKYIRISQNDKKMAEWSKMIRSKIKNERVLDIFGQTFAEIRTGHDYAKLCFVMYWEIQFDDNLAKLAPAISQATLLTLRDKFLGMGEEYNEEVHASNMMAINLTRLMSRTMENDTNENDSEIITSNGEENTNTESSDVQERTE